MSEGWEPVSRCKKAQQASRIPPGWRLAGDYFASPQKAGASVLNVPRACGLLTEQELKITEEYDATALAAEIRAGRLKCVEVTQAFCKRAAIAHQLVNCLTEIFFEEALEQAKALDAHLAAGKSPLGPLHGVPISLKDSFQVIGQDTSIGIAAFATGPAKTASTLVDVLVQGGAVLYCKTNVPQTLKALDTHNNLFGRTLNPINTALSVGGSSGGEGALVALRGSVLGVGTDVGGSIRIPAMCNGLYGIKPSWQRIPFAGQQGNTADGMAKLALPASAGPIATSLRDCELFMKAVSDAKPWETDIDVVPGTWDTLETCERRNLVVGVVTTDGVIEPLPPIKTLLGEVASSLRSAGITVVDLDIRPIFSQCQSLANAFFGIDGSNYVFDALEKFNEPLSPWLASRLKRKDPKTLEEVRSLQAKKDAIQREFLKLWNSQAGKGKIDVLIAPVAPHPVPEIDRWNGVSYTSTFVLLDYPAGTLPVRTFTHDDTQGEVPSSKPLSTWDKINRELWTNVDRSVYVGSPLSIQVISPKLQERKLCGAMEVIEEALRSHPAKSHPVSKL